MLIHFGDFSCLDLGINLGFCNFLIVNLMQVHRLVVNRDPKFTNFVEVLLIFF